MVPMDVPRVALDMISRFLHGKDYSSGDSMLGVALINIEDTAHCDNVHNKGVKRGGGYYHKFSAAVNEEALNNNHNKTHTKSQFIGGFSSLLSFGISSNRDSSLGVFYIFLILFILLLLGMFFFRFQRSQKQILSRR